MGNLSGDFSSDNSPICGILTAGSSVYESDVLIDDGGELDCVEADRGLRDNDFGGDNIPTAEIKFTADFHLSR